MGDRERAAEIGRPYSLFPIHHSLDHRPIERDETFTERPRRITGSAVLESPAVAEADGVEALVGAGEVGVGRVLEIDRPAVAVVEPEAKLQGNVEQHARAQRLAVGLAAVEIAVVDGGAKAERDEQAGPPLILPAAIEIAAAGGGLGVDGGSERGPENAAQERQAAAEQHLGVDIEAALQIEPGPQVRH